MVVYSILGIRQYFLESWGKRGVGVCLFLFPVKVGGRQHETKKDWFAQPPKQVKNSVKGVGVGVIVEEW